MHWTSSARRGSALVLSVLTLASLAAVTAAEKHEVTAFQIGGTEGFRVERVAGPEEATNVYAMTLDNEGQAIVSGPGYIRRLTDRDGDGYLEHREELLAGPESGCQGLLCLDDDLYFVSRGGLYRMPLSGSSSTSPTAPEVVLALTGGGEHGPHAVRRGADGFLYLLGGNHAGFDPRQIRGFSPVRRPYAGLLLRLNLDASEIGVIAHGMRNSYDFDFLPDGEIVVWDSDGERDVGFPWYRPTRLYHLTPGADCGWRSSGSGKVPTYAMDTVAPVAEAGRGSPTGLVAYQHRGGSASFPERYQGNVFALDWTFGRVLFFPLKKTAVSYRSAPEVFLESTAGVSFAPTDIEVAPDGALIISSGGRGLDGALFRVVPQRKRDVEPPSSTLDEVLRAPAPLAAWSRAQWTQLVSNIDTKAIAGVLSDEQRPVAEKLRALDVVGEFFSPAAASAVRRTIVSPNAAPTLRARAAWWDGTQTGGEGLRKRLGDPDPGVLRVALEGAARRARTWNVRDLAPLATSAAEPPAETRRFRQAIAYTLGHDSDSNDDDARTHFVLAQTYGLARLFAQVTRSPRGRFPFARSDLSTPSPDRAAKGRIEWLQPTTPTESLLEQLRLLQIAYEHLLPERDGRRVFFQRPWKGPGDTGPHVWDVHFDDKLQRLVGSDDLRVSREAARLAGALGRDDLVSSIVSRITAASLPGEDVLTLSFLTRMRRPWKPVQLKPIARAVLDLATKVEQLQVGRDARWHSYLRSLWQELTERQPELALTALEHAAFGHPDHTALAEGMTGYALAEAVSRFTTKSLPNNPSQRQLVVSFLASYPLGAAKQVLRTVWDDPAHQGLVLKGLARKPLEEDRELFHAALDEGKRLLVADALEALTKLPAPDTQSAEGRREWLAVLRWGFALDGDPNHVKERDLAATQLARLSNEDANYARETKTSQRGALETWKTLYPGSAGELAEALAELSAFEERFAKIVATEATGNVRRGQEVFRTALCASCHTSGGQGGRFGPDLNGLGKRFSRAETLESIFFPDRQVAERYRTRMFVLNDGTTLEGLTVYRSPAATLIRTREGALHRIESGQVAGSSDGVRSFMPAGLLDGLSAQQIEDLVAFLRR